MNKLPVLAVFFLTACVTINIYFPAAAAEKVADEIIREIQQNQPPESDSALPPQSSRPAVSTLALALQSVLDVLVKPAHAEPNLNADTPEIRRIRASMKSRYAQLNGYYNREMLAIKNDGMLTVPSGVPLNERNRVNKLVQAENADRNRLYQAIANANGHPEWTGKIKATFAKRWISNAHSGWWYQLGDGSWKQK